MKLKKFLTPFVAAAMLMSTVLVVNAVEAETAAEAADETIAAPASVDAATGIGSKPFSNKKVFAYTGRGSFTVTTSSVTAEMSMTEGSGYVTPNPTCQAVGYVKNSRKVDIVTINSSGVMSCKYENTFTEIPAESSCEFYMVGESVETITFGG